MGGPGHVTPEAQLGGPLALVKDGDRIIVDATTRQIDWLVDNETKEARRKEWETQGKRELKVKRGVLYRYARDVAVSSRFFVIMASVLRTDGTGPAACKCRCVLRLISDFCDLYDVRYISVKFLKQREKQLLRLECHQTLEPATSRASERPSVLLAHRST